MDWIWTWLSAWWIFFGFYTPCKEVNGGNGRLFGLKLQCASFVHCVFSSGVFLVGTRHEKLDCNTDVSRRQNWTVKKVWWKKRFFFLSVSVFCSRKLRGWCTWEYYRSTLTFGERSLSACSSVPVSSRWHLSVREGLYALHLVSWSFPSVLLYSRFSSSPGLSLFTTESPPAADCDAWIACQWCGQLVVALSPVSHKWLHQGWTQTSFYLQIIHFTSHYTTSHVVGFFFF